MNGLLRNCSFATLACSELSLDHAARINQIFPIYKLLLTALILVASHAAAAASFSCRANLIDQEKLICADEESSGLDSKLATLYGLALDLAKDKAAIKAEQRKWIAGARAQCKDIDCIQTTYRSRIFSIENELSRNAVSLDKPISGVLDSPCSSETGDRFAISIGPGGAPGAALGKTEGWSHCGNKVWDAAELNGRLVGNVAEVKFNGGWDVEDWYEAFVVAYGAKIYWRVIQHPIKSEMYVPFTMAVPISRVQTQ